MIFVTVGTHEQPFNRLVEYIDNLVKDKRITEQVVIQTGYSTYEPKYCQWKKLFPYSEMIKYVNDARIVITHGGPSSFIMPLQVGKIPIVVPRKKEFNEHVNDHQLEFANAVAKRQRNILVVENTKDIESILMDYDNIIHSMSNEIKSNNTTFNKKLEMLVKQVLKK